MKKLIKPFLIGIVIIIPLFTVAQQKHKFQDTAFIKSYIPSNKISYLYSEPNVAAKTKIRIPHNIFITTIRKSGNFEYGDFSVSSTKKFKGWFMVSDLKKIVMTPPKVIH